MKPKVSLKPFHKRLLFIGTALLWLTGALWVYFNYFGQVQGEYGLQAHPAQPLLLEIHGAAAMGFLILFGMLLIEHVPAGWREKRQRPSGVSLIVLSAALTVTGWGLYYSGSGELRKWIAWVHWGLGLTLPLLLAIHVLGRNFPLRKSSRT